MHQVKELKYRGYQIVITEADKDNDEEYGFGFEIYEIGKDINLVRRYSVFESYGSCEFDSIEDAKEVAEEFIDDYALY